jgi:hypothetical protein
MKVSSFFFFFSHCCSCDLHEGNKAVNLKIIASKERNFKLILKILGAILKNLSCQGFVEPCHTV